MTELILKWLGGWAGPLATIFRRPPDKKRLESASGTKENQGKARRAKALEPKIGWQDLCPASLKMSSASSKRAMISNAPLK